MPDQLQPPMILDCAVVLAYAVHDEQVRYTGRGSTYYFRYTDRGPDYSDARLVGPDIKRSAICRNLAQPQDFLFCYCAVDWSVEAAVGHGTLEEARAYASRMYSGIERVTIETSHSPADIEAALEAYWEGRRCSVCGKWPHDVESLALKEIGRVCGECA